MILLLLFYPLGHGYSQILEALPDEVPVRHNNLSSSPIMSGHTFSGATGLVTIPTANFQQTTVGISWKRCFDQNRIRVLSRDIITEKEERYYSIRYNPLKELELTFNKHSFNRTTVPEITSMNFSNRFFGFGAKYSFEHGEQDVAFGFTFTPMSASEMNSIDLQQLEAMRNLYLTFSEEVAKNLVGHLNVTHSFTRRQKVELSDGSSETIPRNNILHLCAGIEYHCVGLGNIFGEVRFGNYRDFFENDSVRYTFNAGLRLGTDNLNGEILGLNLSGRYPTLVFGANMAY